MFGQVRSHRVVFIAVLCPRWTTLNAAGIHIPVRRTGQGILRRNQGLLPLVFFNWTTCPALTCDMGNISMRAAIRMKPAKAGTTNKTRKVKQRDYSMTAGYFRENRSSSSPPQRTYRDDISWSIATKCSPPRRKDRTCSVRFGVTGLSL